MRLLEEYLAGRSSYRSVRGDYAVRMVNKFITDDNLSATHCKKLCIMEGVSAKTLEPKLIG